MKSVLKTSKNKPLVASGFMKTAIGKQHNLRSSVVNTPRNVLRGVYSQNQGSPVGIHWLRVSCNRRDIRRLREYVDCYFGESKHDERGLWSYDTCYRWLNGTTLNFDSDIDRNDRVHNGMATLDCNGGALEDLASDDLHNFIAGLAYFVKSCTRIDIYFDDYSRLVTPTDIAPIAEKGDYSRFIKSSIRRRFESGKLIHDEVSFGERGQNGSGKYLRVYDKNLESKGEFNCVRWECEFSGERADEIFSRLSKTADLTAFATLCGSLVGGSIVFVKRTGDKNISRLEKYEFWEQIIKLLGCVVVRVRVEAKTIDKSFNWVHKQVSPTLACLRSVFVSEADYLNWLLDVLNDGELRLTIKHRQLIEQNKNKFDYVKDDYEL